MSIRSKILLLLLSVAFVPALITAWLDTRLLRSLSDDLGRRHAAVMEEQALALMDRVAGEYAGDMERESERVRMMVTVQADYVRRLLESPAERAGAVHFDDAFDRREPALELEQAEPRSSAGGSAEGELLVSWHHQVFRVSPGIEREEMLPLARALLPMTDLYRALRTRDDRLIRWHYVVLERGLSATYPGHGAYPSEYDSRARPWYAAQKDAPGFRWFRPHFDASTHALVLNASMPLLGEHGEFLGITAIDVDLTASFELLSLPPHLREGSEFIQAAVVRPPVVAVPQVVVIARQSGTLRHSDWEVLPELRQLAIGDAETTNAITAAMLNGRDGQARAMLNGREYFVLYRGFGATGGYLVMAVPVELATRAAVAAARHADEITSHHVQRLLLFMLMAMTSVLGIALVSSRHVTRPIRQLSAAVEQLAKGRFDTRVTIATGDELQTLGNALNTMVPRLEEHAKVKESLALAREVQQQLLPKAPPIVDGYDIAGVSVYSAQTGGDYFDYLPLTDTSGTHYAIVVADVSGHGIGPALLMATTRALLHGGEGRGFTLAGLLDHVNRQLADDISRGHFVTLFMLGLDVRSHDIEWVSAGHDGALLWRAASATGSALTAEDIPLGIDAAWHYSAGGSSVMCEGDIVLLATDGAWDAIDEHGNRFGKERIAAYLAAHANDSSTCICQGLLETIARFRGAAAQSDDITLVVVKRLAAAADSEERELANGPGRRAE